MRQGVDRRLIRASSRPQPVSMVATTKATAICLNPKECFHPGSDDTMHRKLIPATELAEFVCCAKAWQLKYVRGAVSSAEAQQFQVEGNAWHAAQGRQLAQRDSFRWAAFIALMLAVMLFFFIWMGWAR